MSTDKLIDSECDPTDPNFNLKNVCLNAVYNKTESHVIKVLAMRLTEPSNAALYRHFTSKDIQDIYALALNQLPARYVQKHTIMFKDGISLDKVNEAVDYAISIVSDNPKD